ncbi:TadA family conjugal transfer-associated ATPase [Buchananella hordeovulneris]|nr:TadA family conjugal transfer-associated ATPase [Buchananella hordeovulneris]
MLGRHLRGRGLTKARHRAAQAHAAGQTGARTAQTGQGEGSVVRAVARGASVTAAVAANAGPGADVVQLAAELARTRAELAGPGPLLAGLLADQSITDVLVNGPEVWVDRGAGLHKLPTQLDPKDVARTATHLAAACGRRLDEACPIVDATLPTGTRLHAVLPPLAANGPLLSLRTHRARALSLPELVRSGMVSPALAPILRALIARRLSGMVCGATGTGKTTLLGTLLGLVAPTERIICLEEAAELQVTHPHVLHLQERGENVEGAGQVSVRELLRAALRMRPDRLVLGECRGPEVIDVLAALNTGHEGGWATVHANRAEDVPARLVALGALAGLAAPVVAAQAASALDVVIGLKRQVGAGDASGGRRVREIACVSGADGTLRCPVALRVDDAGVVRPGPAVDALRARLGTLVDEALAGMRGGADDSDEPNWLPPAAGLVGREG